MSREVGIDSNDDYDNNVSTDDGDANAVSVVLAAATDYR